MGEYRKRPARRGRMAGMLAALLAASWLLGQVRVTGFATGTEEPSGEKTVYCGIEDHEHTEECYVKPKENSTQEDTQSQTQLTGVSMERSPMGFVYMDESYLEALAIIPAMMSLDDKGIQAFANDTPLCNIQEHKEHNDDCLEVVYVQACDVEGEENHHVHNEDDKCFGLGDPELSCDYKEQESHTHDEKGEQGGCRELICAGLHLQHDHACFGWYTTCDPSLGHDHHCDILNNSHGDDDNNLHSDGYGNTTGWYQNQVSKCWAIDWNSKYCPYNMQLHTEHDDSCYKPCDLAEHIHEDKCYTRPTIIVCEQTENHKYDPATCLKATYPKCPLNGELHVHTGECYYTEEDMPPYPLTPEEREEVTQIINRINALLSSDEFETLIQSIKDEVDDNKKEELKKQLSDYQTTISNLNRDYNNLSTAKKCNVTNAQKLGNLRWVLDIDPNTLNAVASNPDFTVQYWAYIKRPDGPFSSGYAPLPIAINDHSTPKNGKTVNYMNLWVPSGGGAVAMRDDPQKIYADEHMTWRDELNILQEKNSMTKSYGETPKEVWILHYGGDPDKAKDGEWDKITWEEGMHFTNDPQVAKTDTKAILIERDAVVRLMYATPEEPEYWTDDNANFYDYDISNGKVYTALGEAVEFDTSDMGPGDTYTSKHSGDTIVMHTVQSGINDPANYQGSGTKFAFGHNNMGTGLGLQEWQNNGAAQRINTLNSNNTYDTSYSIMQDNLVNGQPAYSSGIIGPPLFSGGTAIGKYSYPNQTLTFKKQADSYVLTSVGGGYASATGLDTFQNTTGAIYSNEFWPLQTVPSTDVPGHDFQFGGTGIKRLSSENLTPGDDSGEQHNSYFGMEYALKFDLTKNFVGPLDFYFYGDDDLWVYLDGKLVIDIGGVHSSVGQYVNLWDYIKQGTEGSHELKIFFTERGASGSTCWFHFDIPNLSAGEVPDTPPDPGKLVLQKKVQDQNGKAVSDTTEFTFKIEVWKDQDAYDAKKTAADHYGFESDESFMTSKGSIANGGKVTLKSGERIELTLPPNSYYKITETQVENYTPYVGSVAADNQKNSSEGTFINGGAVTFINQTTVTGGPALPLTGGPGTYLITFSALVLMGGAVMYATLRRRREAV